MQNLIRFNLQTVTDAVNTAETFLLRQQEQDGCWRDYNLPPGQSEAWTTAVVLWSLACTQPSSLPVTAVNAATTALHALHKETGWGYNRQTATDGDSTAWTCRVLAALHGHRGLPLTQLLRNYIEPNGSSKTFLYNDKFGTWAGSHADVQPMIGLALVKCYADAAFRNDDQLTSIIFRLRHYCINSVNDQLRWKAFWWTTDAYPIACNLEFLQASGGVPEPIRQSATEWLMNSAGPASSFEAALQLKIACLTNTDPDLVAAMTDNLIGLQQNDGTWPASTVLLVPDQFPVDASKEMNKEDKNDFANQQPAHADVKRLMSTAMALTALKPLLGKGFSIIH